MTGQERRRSPSFTLRSTAQSLGPRTRTVDLSGPRTRWGLCGTLGARRLQTSLRLSQSAPSLAHCRPRTHQYLGAAGRTEGCPRPKAPGPRAAPAAWQRRPGPGEGSRCWAAPRSRCSRVCPLCSPGSAAQPPGPAPPPPTNYSARPAPALTKPRPRRALGPKDSSSSSLCTFTFTLHSRVGAEAGSDRLGRRASALSWVRTPSQKLRCSPSSRLRSGSAGIRRPVFPIACQTVPGSP